MVKLCKKCPDGRVWQVGGDAGEADGGDGVTGRPAVDQGTVAGHPGDAGDEEGHVVLVLLHSEENQAQCTQRGGARSKTACPKPYGLPTWQRMSHGKALHF
jgi:hypothetical protein